MHISRPNLFSSIILLFYCSFLLVGISHHELWGDELHSWNIAKGSKTLSDLFQNIKYEGHPPLWYLFLYSITRVSHELIWLKMLQAFFAIGTAAIIIYKSPFNTLQKILVLCGYYFAYEYAVLARNYMPAVFFACCIAALDKSRKRFFEIIYYGLLFLLSNVHLIGLLLAVSIHSSFCYEKIKSTKKNSVKFLGGFLIFIPAVYFILPPDDSQLNYQFWVERWNYRQLSLFVSAIVNSLFPFPDISNQHWWNTNLFVENDSFIFRAVAFLLFIFLLTAIIYSVRKNKSALAMLLVNLVLTGLWSLIFPLNSYRYAGFIFIGYLIAAWIAMNRGWLTNKIFYILLLIQIPAACIAYGAEVKQKFSTAEQIREVFTAGLIEPGSLVATDYWTLNNLSAYMDSSFYTIELHRNASFLLWNSEMKSAIKFVYAKGLRDLLQQNNGRPYYFFSMKSREQAAGWSQWVKITPIYFSGPAVERSGEIYLYRIESIK